jgi:D-alanyl-D-alanine dipeptidase
VINTRSRRLALALATGALAVASASCAASTDGRGRAATTVPATMSASSLPAETSPAPRSTSASSTPTTSATTSAVPPVSLQARADGLVDVRTVIPDAIVDLRYATTDNFTHVRLYPPDARCLVHTTMVPGLRMAAARLRASGDVLVFWDCYRPHSVQVRMFQVVPDPNWVARPGAYARSHESGRSVDVTLARRVANSTCTGERVDGHCLLDMGTGFDDFTARAHAYATDGVSNVARADRGRLRAAMAAGGLSVYSGEWWHFDGPGALEPRPILAAPVD